VKFDLAGVRAEDIQLEARGRQLRVSGVRRDFSLLEEQQIYSMEISYNRFQRSVELPLDLTQAEIRNEYRDGMLLVLITPRSSR
jgi:HSP20 family molecular chaperone IbpA